MRPLKIITHVWQRCNQDMPQKGVLISCHVEVGHFMRSTTEVKNPRISGFHRTTQERKWRILSSPKAPLVPPALCNAWGSIKWTSLPCSHTTNINPVVDILLTCWTIDCVKLFWSTAQMLQTGPEHESSQKFKSVARPDASEYNFGSKHWRVLSGASSSWRGSDELCWEHSFWACEKLTPACRRGPGTNWIPALQLAV